MQPCAPVWGDMLYVANAGDCRTVLCRDYPTSAHAALSAGGGREPILWSPAV
jgi:hypothetical protein